MRAALIATILAASAAASLPAATNSPDTEPAARDQPAVPAAQAAPGSSAASDAPDPKPEPPLIAYALELNEAKSRADVRGLHGANTALRSVTFEMSRSPPPRDEDCAQTLGANRFAEQYERLATIHDQLGDFEEVVRAYESALACMPRAASYEASIAAAYLSLDRVPDARAAVERGHALDPDDRGVRDVRARLDFIQERWADATARYRLLVLDEKYLGSPLSEYARCYLWLAQRRAGVRDPDVPRLEPPTPVTTGQPYYAPPADRWPTPIFETLRGERSEADLAGLIRDKAPERQTHEWLTEALFYVGERRLAEGDAEAARRHFATVVNLRVVNFVEYGMARAELKKMRERAPVADAAPSETGVRAR